MNDDDLFLSGMSELLRAYAKAKSADVKDIHVRLILADGGDFVAQGLSVAGPAGSQNWGMIYGPREKMTHALVIREQHVLKAEFEIKPQERKPIGYQTEATV